MLTETDIHTLQDLKVMVVKNMLTSLQKERDLLVRLTLYQKELASRLRLASSNGHLENSLRDVYAQANMPSTRQKENVQQLKAAFMGMVRQISMILDCKPSADLQRASQRTEEEEKSIRSCETRDTNRVCEQPQGDVMESEAPEDGSNSKTIKEEESRQLREEEPKPKQTEETRELEPSEDSKRVPKVNRKEYQGFKPSCDAHCDSKSSIKISKKKGVLFEKLKSATLIPPKRESNISSGFNLKEALGGILEEKFPSLKHPHGSNTSERDRLIKEEEI